MAMLEIYPFLKYYKGEKEPPSNYNDLRKKWWFGERQFIEDVFNNKNILNHWKKFYRKELKAGHLNGKLVDTGVDEMQRLTIFYLDLWHGKWFPYDSFDLINDY